jgi:hypothetical protein
MQLRPHWIVCALALRGCGDARLINTFTDSTTRIRVSPAAFLGDVPCVPGTDGALQSYVVSLVQVTVGRDAGGEPETLRSPPIGCKNAVQFPVTLRRLYAADVEAFDTPPETTPPGASPRWTASCGRGTPGHDPASGVDPLAPTEAVFGQTVPLRGCTDLLPTGALPRARVEVRIDDSLGDLRCGSGSGEVGYFEAALGTRTQAAACGAAAVFELEATEAGYHEIAVTAFEGRLVGDAGADGGDGGSPPATSPPDASVDAAAPSPDAAAPGPDATAPPAADAGDAGPAAALAMLPDAGPSDTTTGSAPRWVTRCGARAVPGATARAACDPLMSIAP